ncbi:MAG: rhodanese-like domain-containing protein [Chloroflexota bacterium]
MPLDEIASTILQLQSFHADNVVVVVMSNDETAATQAWRYLVAANIPNVYILEGGINHWIAVFSEGEDGIMPVSHTLADDVLRYTFPAALGSRYQAADPDPHAWALEYSPKIQLQRRRAPSGGGCG